MRFRPLGWSKKTNLLERPGVDLAVLGQLQRCQSPFASGCRAAFSPKMSASVSCVRMIVLSTGRHREEVHAEQEHQQRQARRVVDALDSPPRCVARAQTLERRRDEGEADEDDDPELENHLRDVVEDVVPHLVPHDGLDLRQRRAVE